MFGNRILANTLQQKMHEANGKGPPQMFVCGCKDQKSIQYFDTLAKQFICAKCSNERDLDQ